MALGPICQLSLPAEEGVSSNRIFELVDWAPIEARLAMICPRGSSELATAGAVPGDVARNVARPVRHQVGKRIRFRFAGSVDFPFGADAEADCLRPVSPRSRSKRS